MTRRDAETAFAARAWLRRHGFTAGRAVEDLARSVADAHAEGTPEEREREAAELAAIVDGLRGWLGSAEDYLARMRGDR